MSFSVLFSRLQKRQDNSLREVLFSLVVADPTLQTFHFDQDSKSTLFYFYRRVATTVLSTLQQENLSLWSAHFNQNIVTPFLNFPL